jgi:hypothetical protein
MFSKYFGNLPNWKKAETQLDLGDNVIWVVNDGDDGWTYQSSQWSHAATTGLFNKSFKVATSIVILEDGKGHVEYVLTDFV